MNNDLLREIIDVEKELQRALDQEKERARVWLEARKKELEEERAGKERELRTSFQTSREEIRREAESKAADAVKREERAADRISSLTTERLTRIVENHIHGILPE